MVKHRLLDLYRAAKIISKNSQNAEKLLQEANLLKNLQHPGIPSIYDIEEDSSSICIIEEYIAGKSLREYMNLHKSIEINRICQIFIELCDILEYLHGYGINGIIHLDLKPENMIIDVNHHLWLIDFDNAIKGGESKEECEGTIYFAAPEQYHRLNPNKQADIYGIGMLLMYMTNHQNVHSGMESLEEHILYPIIKKCLHHNQRLRYRNAAAVRNDLLRIQNLHENIKKNRIEHSVIIGVRGARHGIGATHLCLCMAAFFAQQKLSVACIDFTANQHMAQEGMKGVLMADGGYLYKGISIYPDYHQQIKCPVLHAQVCIIDAGMQDFNWIRQLHTIGISDTEQAIEVIVADGKYGGKEEEMLIEKANENAAVFVNHMSGMQFYEYAANQVDFISFFGIPCIYDWTNPGELFDNVMTDFMQQMTPELSTNRNNNWMEGIHIEIAKHFCKVKSLLKSRKKIQP